MCTQERSAELQAITITREVRHWFQAVDKNKAGKIKANELQTALFYGQGTKFSNRACSLMIGVFDHDKIGTIDIYEFQVIYTYIKQWTSVFRIYDVLRFNIIEEIELNQAFLQMGFRFNPCFAKFLVRKFDTVYRKYINIDQFIIVCLQIQKFSEAFIERDPHRRGFINVCFEDYLRIAFTCSV